MSQGYVGSGADAARIRRLEEQRQREKAEFAAASVRDERSRLVSFAASNAEAVEHAFKADTVGLQTKAQFAEKRANVEKELERERLRLRGVAEEAELRAQSRKRAAQHATATARLSFVDAEEEEEPVAVPADAGAAAKRPRFGAMGKNPEVDTSFLPDRAREREEQAARESLKAEWEAQQTALKAQALKITYSYHDGGGHRRSITVHRGDSVATFLRAVRDALAPEFRELKAASVEDMLYVKEDLILPHTLTFHELISTRARGKSGPLFHFDVHDDVRLQGDARVEKDEAHAGKVLERHWYAANKHIFPASRWEVYDPLKAYGGFTVHGPGR